MGVKVLSRPKSARTAAVSKPPIWCTESPSVQLSEAPGGKLRPFQLILALDWEQSRLSHLLTRMSRRRFVVRQDCAADRRGADVVLTAAGRAAIESAAPGHVAAVRRLVFDQMDSEQAAAFGRVFEAILAGLEDPGRLRPDRL